MPLPEAQQKVVQLALGVGLVIALAVPGITVLGQSVPPDNGPAGRRVMAEVVGELTSEAEAAREAARFEHPKPDFATRFAEPHSDMELPLDDVQRALVRAQSTDAFVDAYIRWQLTSFDVELPELDDRAFVRFLGSTPPMVENPKAAPRVLNTIRAAEKAGGLSPDDVELLQRSLAELDEKALIMKEMNRPGIEYREWMARKLGEKGLRPRQWMIEGLAATVMAGWPSSRLKGAMTRHLGDAIEDESLTPEHRQTLIRQLRKLSGLQRHYLDRIDLFANGTMKASIRRTFVDRGNVERWHKRLLGIRD